MAERTCCGKTCDTPYCPFCGYQGEDHSIQTLLSYCRGQQARAGVKLAKDLRSRVPSEYTIGRSKLTVSKWDIWVNELEIAMKKQ